METKRYRALQRYSYARALEALVILARTWEGPAFRWGPMDLTALERNGLTLTGADLSGVSLILSEVPGIIEVPA